MNEPIFIMMVGLPASGKSTKAIELALTYNAKVHSSDAIREELSGDVNNQDLNDVVFSTLHARVKAELLIGRNVIYDATNLNYKRRMSFLQQLNKIPCRKECHVMAVPFEICTERNELRNRVVPAHAMEKMYRSFNIPYWYEGWDDIVICDESYCGLYGSPYDWAYGMRRFDQKNPHHALTLGEHCAKTFKNALAISEDACIAIAALIHDCGKPFAKSFTNRDGEKTPTAHYYDHQNVGAYDNLFFDYPANKLDISVLIQWHMRPYLAWDVSEKSKEKDRKLLGDELFDRIMLLHECDVAAH